MLESPALISADDIVAHLRKTTQDAALRGLIAQFGLDAEKLKFKGGKGDLVAVQHGVTFIFHQAAASASTSTARSKKVGRFSDVQFSARGYQGGPPFAGALPRGVRFDMNREQIHRLLGPPVATAMLGIPNERWGHGNDGYFTLDFLDDYSGIKKVTIGALI